MPKGWLFERGCMNRHHLTRNGWVPGVGGTDFLHCWVTGSISLERAESLITKR